MGSAQTVIGIDIAGEAGDYILVGCHRLPPPPLHGQGYSLLAALPSQPYLFLFLICHPATLAPF
jgi:hypothetical protein